MVSITDSVLKKILVYIFVCLFSLDTPQGKICHSEVLSENNNEFRACWISYIDIEEFLKDINETAFRKKIQEMVDKLAANKINTIIFQVRPMGDAVYYSEYFHLSAYISSDGYIPYDPFSIVVETAHNKGMKVHAWINPYRLSLGDETTDYYKSCPDYNKYKEFIIEYTDSSGESCLSLDPAREETICLICNGITELLNNYDIDGIHFDDYFYMPGMVTELAVEEKKSNVNRLIIAVYKAIKNSRPDCLFGISPAGNPDYARSIGADIDTWLSTEGYIDYIIPQLYWTDNYILNGEKVSMYTDRCIAWSEINTLNVPMYAGLALYKVNEAYDNDLDWKQRDNNLQNQYKILKKYNYNGYALFRYKWITLEECQIELQNLKYETSLSDTMEICGIIYNKIIKFVKKLL